MAKTVTLASYVIQYRRRTRIGRELPDGIWHSRIATTSYDVARERLQAVQCVAGAYLFEWRIIEVPQIESKAIQ